jgi:flagellar assembly protein FliH
MQSSSLEIGIWKLGFHWDLGFGHWDFKKMGVIKAEHTPLSLEAFSMRDIEQQAQAILLRARKGAEMLLVEAQRESVGLKKQAKSEGFNDGRREGMALGLTEGRTSGHQAALDEAKERLSQVWKSLTATVAQLETSRRDLESDGITEVIALATAIARRVTKRQSAIDPAVLLENIREAMKLAVHAIDVRIVINPAQRKTVSDELPKLQMTWPNLNHVELIDDPSVSVGGCKILTRNGEIDADIQRQLDRVIDDLLPSE